MPSSEYISYRTQKAIDKVRTNPTIENKESLKDHFVILSEGNILTVPHGFGSVLFMSVCSTGFVFWTWFKASQAKRDYIVPNLVTHNDMYMTYNCIYRGYKSTHEVHLRLLFHLIFSGLEMPVISATATFIWMFGRWWYMQGYFSREPRNRGWGWWHCVGFQILQLGALRYAFKRMFW